MNKILAFALCLLLSLSSASANEIQKFSPEKFQAELEQFITQEAGLTQEESAKFFPLYREMLQKQRALYHQMKELGKNKPADEASIKKAVQRRDELEIELKQILRTYHQKFFKVLPASKVYDVIRAEDRFHRRAFKNWGNGNKPPHHKK